MYLPPMGPRKGLGVAPRDTSNGTQAHMNPALSACVSGGDWVDGWSTEVVACEGRGAEFWGSSETVDLVALGRGVIEIQNGAPFATQNQVRKQERNQYEERLRKPSPGPCGVIRTPREDKDGGSVNTQEPRTGTPKGVPENVTLGGGVQVPTNPRGCRRAGFPAWPVKAWV